MAVVETEELAHAVPETLISEVSGQVALRLVPSHSHTFILKVLVEGFDHASAIDGTSWCRTGSKGGGVIEIKEISTLLALHQRSQFCAQHFVYIVGASGAVRKFSVVIEQTELYVHKRKQGSLLV